MYARLIETETTPARVDELAVAIRRELVTALRGQHGFSGALSLIDRTSARSLLVVLWETELEAGRPLVDCNAPILATFSCSTPLGSTVWEVCART
jgi:hypothetical protein